MGPSSSKNKNIQISEIESLEEKLKIHKVKHNLELGLGISGMINEMGKIPLHEYTKNFTDESNVKSTFISRYIQFLIEFCDDLQKLINKQYSNIEDHDEKIKFLHEETQEENFLRTTKEMHLDKIEIFSFRSVNCKSWLEETLEYCKTHVNSTLTLREAILNEEFQIPL
jgi:hypothetical protein